MSNTLSFKEFDNLNFQLNSDYLTSDSIDSVLVYSDLYIPLPTSEYYNQEQFEQLLQSACVSLILYNINSILNNQETFLLCSGICDNDRFIDVMAFCASKLSEDIEH